MASGSVRARPTRASGQIDPLDPDQHPGILPGPRRVVGSSGCRVVQPVKAGALVTAAAGRAVVVDEAGTGAVVVVVAAGSNTVNCNTG